MSEFSKPNVLEEQLADDQLVEGQMVQDQAVDKAADVIVDAQGESCPMPLLKAKMALNKMAEGEVLKVIATDAGSVRDFRAFISLTPHELTEDTGDSSRFVYYITKQG